MDILSASHLQGTHSPCVLVTYPDWLAFIRITADRPKVHLPRPVQGCGGSINAQHFLTGS